VGEVKQEGVNLASELLPTNSVLTLKTNLFDSHVYFCDFKLKTLITSLKRTSIQSFKKDFLVYLVEHQHSNKLKNILKINKKFNIHINLFIEKNFFTYRINNIADYLFVSNLILAKQNLSPVL
jgi:hypothetical protein